MLDRKPGQLTEAEPARRRSPDQALEPRTDGAGQGSHVLDGGRHDRAEQSVDLRDRVLMQRASRQMAVPASDVDRADVAEAHVGERRRDVAESAFIDLFRSRPDRALLDPPVGVFAERDLAGVWVDPVTPR